MAGDCLQCLLKRADVHAGRSFVSKREIILMADVDRESKRRMVYLKRYGDTRVQALARGVAYVRQNHLCLSHLALHVFVTDPRRFVLYHDRAPAAPGRVLPLFV